MGKKPTLKDIAKLANVSVSTVSRIVNGGEMTAASHEVQDRIWEVVKTLDYIPNVAAQELKSNTKKNKEQKNFACIFTRLREVKSDPFFNEIARAIEVEALKLGYLMKYSVSIYSEPETKLKTFLSENQFDGIIIIGKTNRKQVDLISKYTKNVVYVSLNKTDLLIDQVICDGYESAIKALEYLSSSDTEDLYYLGETVNEVRYEAFCDFMILNGHSTDFRNYIIETRFSLEDSYNNLKKSFERKKVPKKLFCGNDITALGAIKAIKEQGVRIPEDIEVVGIDNIEMAQFTSPMLTTINVPTEQLGVVAARCLADKIENGNFKSPITISIPSTLIVRETTKP